MPWQQLTQQLSNQCWKTRQTCSMRHLAQVSPCIVCCVVIQDRREVGFLGSVT